MKTRHIKWVLTALCLVLCLGLLVACGGDDTPTETTADTKAGDTTADTMTDTSATEETQAEVTT